MLHRIPFPPCFHQPGTHAIQPSGLHLIDAVLVQLDSGVRLKAMLPLGSQVNSVVLATPAAGKLPCRHLGVTIPAGGHCEVRAVLAGKEKTSDGRLLRPAGKWTSLGGRSRVKAIWNGVFAGVGHPSIARKELQPCQSAAFSNSQPQRENSTTRQASFRKVGS